MENTGEIKCLGGKLALELVRGNYAYVSSKVSLNLKELIKEENIAFEWRNLEENAGKYISLIKNEISNNEAELAVEITLLYENAKLKVNLKFNQNKEVINILFVNNEED